MNIKNFVWKYLNAEYRFVSDFNSLDLNQKPYYDDFYSKGQRIKIVSICNNDLVEYEIKKGKVKDYINDKIIAIIIEHYGDDKLNDCWTEIIVKKNSFLNKESYVNALKDILIDKTQYLLKNINELSPDKIIKILINFENVCYFTFNNTNKSNSQH